MSYCSSDRSHNSLYDKIIAIFWPSHAAPYVGNLKMNKIITKKKKEIFYPFTCMPSDH